MAENKRVEPMKVGSGAYLAMARMYLDWAQLVRTKMYLTDQEKERVSQLLKDAARDYEETAKEMSGVPQS